MDDKSTITDIVAAMKESAKLGDLLIVVEGLLSGNRFALAFFRLYSKKRQQDLMALFAELTKLKGLIAVVERKYGANGLQDDSNSG